MPVLRSGAGFRSGVAAHGQPGRRRKAMYSKRRTEDATGLCANTTAYRNCNWLLAVGRSRGVVRFLPAERDDSGPWPARKPEVMDPCRAGQAPAALFAAQAALAVRPATPVMGGCASASWRTNAAMSRCSRPSSPPRISTAPSPSTFSRRTTRRVTPCGSRCRSVTARCWGTCGTRAVISTSPAWQTPRTCWPTAVNLFGDERADYSSALQTHYDQGPPHDWPEPARERLRVGTPGRGFRRNVRALPAHRRCA